MDEVNAFCQGQLAAMQAIGPQDAKIRFIGNFLCPPFILDSLFCFLMMVTECYFVFVLQRFWPHCLCLVPTISWPKRSAKKVVPLRVLSTSAKRGCYSPIPKIRYLKKALPLFVFGLFSPTQRDRSILHFFLSITDNIHMLCWCLLCFTIFKVFIP